MDIGTSLAISKEKGSGFSDLGVKKGGWIQRKMGELFYLQKKYWFYYYLCRWFVLFLSLTWWFLVKSIFCGICIESDGRLVIDKQTNFWLGFNSTANMCPNNWLSKWYLIPPKYYFLMIWISSLVTFPFHRLLTFTVYF